MRISGCRLKEKTQDRLAEFLSGRKRDGAERAGSGQRQHEDGRVFLSSASDYRQAIGGQPAGSKGSSRSMRAILAAFAKGKRGVDLALISQFSEDGINARNRLQSTTIIFTGSTWASSLSLILERQN
jgi:hypothetical protein